MEEREGRRRKGEEEGGNGREGRGEGEEEGRSEEEEEGRSVGDWGKERRIRRKERGREGVKERRERR